MYFNLYENKQPNHRVGLHYVIDIEGVKILYTYIRKNACSAFKQLFQGEGVAAKNKYTDPLQYMTQNYLYDLANLSSVDIRMFVYRDPIERIYSLFKNKFIERSGHHDIFINIEKLLGRSADNISFQEFCFNYLPNLFGSEKLDPHVIPQHWHLLPGQYEAAIAMDRLPLAISGLLGENIAMKYFQKRVNATSNISTRYIEDVSCRPAIELHRMFLAEKIFPTQESMVNEDIAQRLKDIYAVDYKMIEHIG